MANKLCKKQRQRHIPMRYILCAILLSLLHLLPLPAADRVATRMGVIGNGKTLNTEAIQQAINILSQKGGGRLDGQ